MRQKFFTQQTIDAAGQLYSQHPRGGWNAVAATLTEKGHTTISGTYVHGQAICSEVLADPQWAHLRRNRAFGSQKRLLIAQAILDAGYNQNDVDNIMKKVP